MKPSSGPSLGDLRLELKKKSDPQKADVLQRFFKTGPGEYGEGDRFLGIVVPELRKLIRSCLSLPLAQSEKLLHSPWHEERLFALLLWGAQYARAENAGRRAIYRAYVRNFSRINNWDLVDLSAPAIVGPQLLHASRRPLHEWAGSPSLWERRISILATFHFIRHGDYSETFALAKRLLRDPEDLLHKAVGWMLREIGKRDQPLEENFLKTCYRAMPRTMLRYAVERFPEPRRRAYLLGKI